MAEQADQMDFSRDELVEQDVTEDADVVRAPVDPNRGSSIGGLTHEEYQEQGATRTRPE